MQYFVFNIEYSNFSRADEQFSPKSPCQFYDFIINYYMWVCVFFLVYYLIYFRQKYAHIVRWRTFNRNARFFDSFVTYFAVAESFDEFMIKLWPFFSFYKNNHSLIHSEISGKRVNKYNYNYIELAINHSALTRNQRHNDIQFLNSIIIPC